MSAAHSTSLGVGPEPTIAPLTAEHWPAAERIHHAGIQSGVFPENAASLRLHERAAFRVVGTRERVGEMTYGPMAGQ